MTSDERTFQLKTHKFGGVEIIFESVLGYCWRPNHDVGNWDGDLPSGSLSDATKVVRKGEEAA